MKRVNKRFDSELITEVEKRFSERTPERERIVRSLARGDYVDANGAKRVEMRLERLGCKQAVAEGIASGDVSAAAAEVEKQGREADPVGLERVLGTNDLISAVFLVRGFRVAQAVARINLGAASRRNDGYGTGFLASNRLLLTNNHVFRSEAEAFDAFAEFNYQETYNGELDTSVKFRLAPDEFFLTNEHLDYSLVAVNPVSEEGVPLERFGWLPLIETQGKAMIGEWVNIIQHPGGEVKQLALRENRIVDLLEHFIHYQTDTAPGSSGAPVFNDQWEVIGLHRSGVPQRNAKGELLTTDGRVWYPALGEHRIQWIANEGTRISRVVAHVKSQELGSPQRKSLRKRLFVPLEEFDPTVAFCSISTKSSPAAFNLAHGPETLSSDQVGPEQLKSLGVSD